MTGYVAVDHALTDSGLRLLFVIDETLQVQNDPHVASLGRQFISIDHRLAQLSQREVLVAEGVLSRVQAGKHKGVVDETVQVDLEFSRPAFDYLVEQSYNPAMGARPVRRAVQQLISNPLSKLVLSGEVTLDDTLNVSYSRKRHELTFRKAG